MVFTPPLVDHAMRFPVDTVFLTLSRNARVSQAYEADTKRVDLLSVPSNEMSIRKNLRRRTSCRLCGERTLELVLSLAPTPPANAFVRADQLDQQTEYFPLDVFFCHGCGHVQLLDIVDPGLLFEHYVYVSGTSPVFVEHFRKYAAAVLGRLTPRPGSLAVDIGSNDGTLLRFFRDAGMRVVGVDPARRIASVATEQGIATIPAFFTAELAASVKAKYGPADLITANNVFAHADDLAGMVRGICELLTPDGLFVLEVSYLVDVFEKTLFDTIYHEHLSYHTVGPLRRFFEHNGMELIECHRVDSHGGSVRCLVQKAGGPRPITDSVAALMAREAELGLNRPGTLRAFASKIEALGRDLADLLRRLKSQGRHIAGYGAPAKATTLLYQMGIGPELLDFIVDDSPLKQGLYSPGHHIPVLPPAALYQRNPDYLLILAWNFADAIMAKHHAFQQNGGRFIVPVPEIRVR
jgi:SAM-dependent methyltransferase